jgi:glucose-6-phosphate 1-dehydrogenase
VGTRGDFYDSTGALRDMIQNHALQLLTMIAMEPPIHQRRRRHPRREAQGAASLKPFTPESVARDVVRGQYKAGTVDGKAVRGYLDEVKVPAGSHCETFVALRTEVQNWRWAGVPFYLRTGKRLAGRHAQIVVNFREVPHPIFPGHARANKLVIKLQPEDGLELHLLAAKGGGQCAGRAAGAGQLDLDFDKAFASERVGAYERLLLDAIAGRLNLFVRSDEQEQAWRWVEPILKAWASDPNGPRPYAAGTWGPPPPARWSRATAAPGTKNSETTRCSTGSRPPSPPCRRPSSAWPSCCWPTRAALPRCRWASWPTARTSASPRWCASAAAWATTAWPTSSSSWPARSTKACPSCTAPSTRTTSPAT